ncbi:hypothetical protein [Streptacidiphilus melanogenes]|uniref:hypothetical protein n=1 Tax=Streptacidiphilus melanogenes TaxID=411235 RepID=UPI000A41F078|nr:hypothetical protein [Streptacidiphilus melanogenes]
MSAEAIKRLAARLRLIAVMATVMQLFFFAGRARADGGGGICKGIPFADKLCGIVQTVNKSVDFMNDPLGYIAQFFNNAVASLFHEMVKALLSSTTIDWSNAGFLRTYGMAFGASTILTVILWLIAVLKRALQGVPPLQAAGESIGFLMLSVFVTALAPAAVAYATELGDQAAAAMFAPVSSDIGSMASSVSTALAVLMAIPGGQIIVIFLALAMLSAIAGVWMELIIRAALILCGLVFGATVFSGLVDRNLWGHCKRWIGVIAGIIASRYVTFTTLALGTGLVSTNGTGPPSVGQAFATVFTGIGVLWLALYLPFTLAKFLPVLGDELQAMYAARDDFKGRAQNIGGKVGDTFGELRNRLGSGDGDDEGDDGDDEGGSEEGDSPAGNALAAKEAADTAKNEAKQTAEQSTSNAMGGADEPPTSADTSTSAAVDDPEASGSRSDAATDPSVPSRTTGSSADSPSAPTWDADTHSGAQPPPAPPPDEPPMHTPPEPPETESS